MQDSAQTRSQLYAALAQAFCKPEAASAENEASSLTKVLQRAAIALDARALGPVAYELSRSLEIGEGQVDQALCALEVEYNRLFAGPERLQAPPYESVYRDPRGLVMGPAAHDVQRRYAEGGLAVSPNHHDLPDHVATELGFMAYLAVREAEAGGEEATAWLEREAAFLREHLTAWLPIFCRRVQAVSRHPFYVTLAELAETFVELDAQHIGAVLRERRGTVST